MFARALALMLMISATASTAAAAGQYDTAGNLVPHKALYTIEMVSKKSSAQILNISGKMFFEWQPSCDAWTTDHRFSLNYDYADSAPLLVNSDFSTYEPFDGRSFDYSSRRKRNGDLYQELRGRAERKDDGSASALYSLPEDLVFELKPGTLFPMAHTLTLLEKAQAGQKFFNSTVFDGSDEDGPVEINAFIGKPVDATALVKPSPEIDMKLLQNKAWRVRMAFFPLNEPGDDSDYEMDIVFHENGIISDMLVEYRDFSVTQKLAALETLQPRPCRQNKGNE